MTWMGIKWAEQTQREMMVAAVGGIMTKRIIAAIVSGEPSVARSRALALVRSGAAALQADLDNKGLMALMAARYARPQVAPMASGPWKQAKGWR